MKYGSTINKKVIDKLPYEKIIQRSGFSSRYQVICDFLYHLKRLTKTKEGIFGYSGRWRIRIHISSGVVKIDYFPNGMENRNNPRGRIHEKFIIWKRKEI